MDSLTSIKEMLNLRASRLLCMACPTAARSGLSKRKLAASAAIIDPQLSNLNSGSRLGGMLLGSLLMLACCSVNAAGETNPFVTGWSFAKGKVAPDAQSVAWEAVTLPHTWNAVDASDGGGEDGRTLYIIALGRPEGTLSPGIVQIDTEHEGRVELVGHPGKLGHRVDGKRLTIELPDEVPGNYAFAFKLTGFKTSLTPAAVKARNAALKQLLEGSIDPGKLPAKPKAKQ